MELKIDKGIDQNCDQFVKTAGQMEVGDSVLFKDRKDGDRLCRALFKTHGAGSFTMKDRDEGFRVWRTKRIVTPRKPKEPAK